MNTKTDVLIVGGGVIGLACAYYLLREGRSVRIIERDTIGEGASGGNCGLLFSSHILPLCLPGTVKKELRQLLSGTPRLIIKPTPNISRLSWLLNFARKCSPTHISHAIKAREEILRHSKDLYEMLFSDKTFKFSQKQNGILIVFKTKEAFEKYANSLKWLDGYNLVVEPVIGDVLFKLEPALSKKLFGGWYYNTDQHVRPETLLEEWKESIIGNGGMIEENCEVENFHTDKRYVSGVKTSKGMFNANDIVLAAGAWTCPIAKKINVNIPIQPGKGYSITFKIPRPFPTIPCILYEERVAVSPWGDEGRVGGLMVFSGLDSTVVAKRIRRIKQGANKYLAESITDSFMDEWAGFRPMCYDDLPVIGRTGMVPNLIIAAGHGTTGLSMAPGTGKLVTEIITGKKPFMDITAFSPDRF